MSNTKQFLEKILNESDETPYCDDVNCEKLKEDNILATNKIYQYEVGILLDKDNPEYDSYSMVYDGQHGFYNEDWGVELNLDEAKKYVQNYVNEGKPNTYGIISEIEVSDEELADIQKNIEDNGYFETSDYEADYSVDNIIYSLYKSDDKIIENFINNSLIDESEKLNEDTNYKKTIETLYKKYNDEFDSISDVETLADTVQRLYDNGGMKAVNDWFLPAASEEYKRLVRKLIIKESDNINYKFKMKEKLNEDEPEETTTEEQSEKQPSESTNEFEGVSPEYQEVLSNMSNNSMYKWVIDDVMDSIIDYDGDSMDEKLRSRLNEITEHGCQSGTVMSLIYYTDTVKFFDDFYDEIYDMVDNTFGPDSVLDSLEQRCGKMDIIMGADTVKNYLAWMAYEEVCYELDIELGNL